MRRRDLRWLVVGSAALFVLRLGLSAFRTGPLIVADEVGYLTNARLLGTGMRATMDLAPFYRGGYSLLIAPIVAAASPSTAYHSILVLNAALAASLMPLLYLLVRRTVDVSPETALLASFLAASYPAVTVLSQTAMSENLLAPLLVVWLLSVGWAVSPATPRATVARFAVVAALAAVGFAVHGRMAVVVAVTVIGAAALAARRVVPARAFAAVVVVTAVGLAASHELDAYLTRRDYGGVASNEAGDRLGNLTSATFAVLRNAVGQSWYVLVATLALPALGAVALRASTGAHLGPRRARITLAALVGTLAGLLVVSALSFPEPDRPDMFVYGRYVEIAVPPLLALSLAVALRVRALRLRGPAAAVAAATAVTVALRLTFTPPRGPNRWDISGLPVPSFQLTAAVLAAAGVAVLVLIAILRLGSDRLRWLLPVLVVLSFAATTANDLRNPVLAGEHDVYGSGWRSPQSAVGDARIVYYDVGAQDLFGLYAYQWFLPHARFVLVDAANRPPRGLLITSAARLRADGRSNTRVLWRDPTRDQVIARVGASTA